MVIVALIGLTSTHAISANRHWRIVVVVMVASMWLLDINISIWGSVGAMIVYVPHSWIKVSLCRNLLGWWLYRILFFSNTPHCFVNFRTNWINMNIPASIYQILKKSEISTLVLNDYTKFQPMTISLGILISQHALQFRNIESLSTVSCYIRPYETSCCHGELLKYIMPYETSCCHGELLRYFIPYQIPCCHGR